MKSTGHLLGIEVNVVLDDKPDKVKRDLISQDYCWGDHKMINLKAFIQGHTLTWVRALIINEIINRPNSPFCPLFVINR
jgi:hypothetical protein